MPKPTKEEILGAIEDGEREGCPYDASELADVFGVSREELEEILESEEK